MRGILCLILLATSVCVEAANVYRCTARDGSVGFQDRPCSDDQTQHQLELPDDPPLPARPDAASDPIAVDDASINVPLATVAPPAAYPPPDFFLCTRYDGSRYLSEDGIGSRSAVPYGMLAGSGRSLADAYGGNGGIGVSAPGLRTAPSIPAAEMPLANTYVWVDDECHHAEPREACAYLRDQSDAVSRKLKRAFSDTAPQLRQEQVDLRERLRGC
jgi:hypothetical protein